MVLDVLEWGINSIFTDWELQHWAIYVACVFGAMGLFSMLLEGPLIFGCLPRIQFKGPILKNTDLRFIDYATVSLNKLITCAYLYHSITIYRSAEWITSRSEDAGIVNTLGAMFIILGVYDAIYVPFHRALHIPAIYPYIHKYHHKQINPFRATFDGINTHWFEFTSGEYLHILSAFITGSYLLPLLGTKLHLCGLILFLLFSAFGASLNHTRHRLRIPGVYDVRTHDIHHHFPRSNYCQYVPWWDQLLGTYIPPVDDVVAYAKSRGVEVDARMRAGDAKPAPPLPPKAVDEPRRAAASVPRAP